MTEMELRAPGAVELIVQLERDGALTPIGLNLTGRDMSYEHWEALGRLLGTIDRASRWWIGDFLNFGEEIFPEEYAQGVESSVAERYSEAERITGLDPQTLMNIRSICGRVPVSRRRVELGFWIHAEVAPLEPDEQVSWLQTAIDKSWTRATLRDAIRETKNPSQPVDPAPPREGTFVSPHEQLQKAARTVWGLCEPHPGGGYLVPAEAMSQLVSALGED